MPEYKNGSFYENLQEANRRLTNTVVTYDGRPYTVLAITDHKPDRIFRVYGWDLKAKVSLPDALYDYPQGSNEWAAVVDKYLDQNPSFPLIRKHINAPAFNRFRPFPLGMMNAGKGRVKYWERTPLRHSEQGLTRNAIIEHYLTLSPGPYGENGGRAYGGPLSGAEVADCITASHPSFEEVIKNLRDPEDNSEGAAFHRHFAVMKGPLEVLYLAYKTQVIGLIGEGEKPGVLIGRDFRHYKEVVEETKTFSFVRLQS
jgi:hypothetical protein